MVTLGVSQVLQSHELVDLLFGVHLCPIEIRLQVVKLVRVGLVGQYRCPVEKGEGVADGVGVVQEIEDEDVVLLRGAWLTRERACTLLMPDSVLSTYMVCKSGSS